MLVGPPPGISHLAGWFEPGLQAPMAKAILVRLSGLYATKLRYGGHEPQTSRGRYLSLQTTIYQYPRKPTRRTCFRPFRVAFVTPIHPFFQKSVYRISTNMVHKPAADPRRR